MRHEGGPKAGIHADTERTSRETLGPVLVEANTALEGITVVLLDGGLRPATERTEVTERRAVVVVRTDNAGEGAV